MYSLIHVNSFLLFLAQILPKCPIHYIQFLANIAEPLHLHLCYFSIFICPFYCRFFHHWNLFQFYLLIQDKLTHQNSRICCKLKRPQMPDLGEMLPNWSRSIPRRVISQNSSKNKAPPLFFRIQLFFSSHIKHTDRDCQFLLILQSYDTFIDQSIFQWISIKQGFEKIPMLIILFNLFGQLGLIFSLLHSELLDDFGIGDPQLIRCLSNILFHLRIFIKTPLIEICLHMLDNKDSIFGG